MLLKKFYKIIHYNVHVQVRVQCFYYLLPRGNDRHNTNSQDPDPKVSELSRVLTSIDEAMTSSLQPRKSKVSVMLGIFDHHLDKIHNKLY